jgi:hypothetical protein
MKCSEIHFPPLKTAVNRLEDGIITLSGPALAVSGIIAGVDLVTGGNILKTVGWLSMTWAICLLLTLDFQVLALGARAHKVYLSDKGAWRKAGEITLAVLIAAAISYVSIQMQSIIARVNSESPALSIDAATLQLGINPIALIWERSILVLALIFLSGWFREEGDKHDEGTASQAVQLSTPVQMPPPPFNLEELLEKLDARYQQRIEAVIQQVKITMEQTANAKQIQAPPALPLPDETRGELIGTGTQPHIEAHAVPSGSQESGTEGELETDPFDAEAQLSEAYLSLVAQGTLSASALARRAHVRKATALAWLAARQEHRVQEV